MTSVRLLATAASAVALSLSPALAQDTAVSAGDTAGTEVASSAGSNAVQEDAMAPVTEADPTDFRAGLQVRDVEGGLVGTVESVDSEGAVVNTGNRRAKLPFASFGKNESGLVISLSRSELEAAAADQSPS